MGHKRKHISKKRTFTGNRFTKNNANFNSTSNPTVISSAEQLMDASSQKLENKSFSTLQIDAELCGNRIFDIKALITLISTLCCPVCLTQNLDIKEDSRFGLTSNLAVKCKHCDFMEGFASSSKINKANQLNILSIFGLRLIGRGFSAGKKLFSSLNLPYLSKDGFRSLEKKLLSVVSTVAEETMVRAANEVINNDKTCGNKCGVTVDGTWQRRGYSSLNGCAAALSVDTGKVLDVEVMSRYCRICSQNKNSKASHICQNHSGNSASMETVGVYRMFERSETSRQLQYTTYYGDGDSKAYTCVKDIYGPNSVEKLECIGHVQKRVGSRLRNMKKKHTKTLGGKGKLTDKFIDKLQNYYGIAIRSNIGNLEQMQSAVIAAFFHCCSNKSNNMHGQCPTGDKSWCKVQRAIAMKTKLTDKCSGLPQNVINIIKSTYMSLCDQSLLKKCLYGKTQNANESFNGLVWTLLPKDVFVELQTLRLGTYLATIQFNDGLSGVLSVVERLGCTIGPYMQKGFNAMDETRIFYSKRQSLEVTKNTRKKLRGQKKKKFHDQEVKEGLVYKCGQF